MSKILLRDRPDPLPPTVYEEEFIKGYQLRNPETFTTGYLAVSGNYATNTSGYITVGSSTITCSSGFIFWPSAGSVSTSGWVIS